MKPAANKAMAILSRTPIPIIVIAVFVLGYSFKGLVSQAPPPDRTGAREGTPEAAEEEIWTCSMHPQIRLPKPGKCPLCGMDLIRAAETPGPKTTKLVKREPKYASFIRLCTAIRLAGVLVVDGKLGLAIW